MRVSVRVSVRVASVVAAHEVRSGEANWLGE